MACPTVPAKKEISKPKIDKTVKSYTCDKSQETFQPGCWGEADDSETTVIVDDIVSGEAIISIFDVSTGIPLEYRDKIPLKEFAKK